MDILYPSSIFDLTALGRHLKTSNDDVNSSLLDFLLQFVSDGLAAPAFEYIYMQLNPTHEIIGATFNSGYNPEETFVTVRNKLSYNQFVEKGQLGWSLTGIYAWPIDPFSVPWIRVLRTTYNYNDLRRQVDEQYEDICALQLDTRHVNVTMLSPMGYLPDCFKNSPLPLTNFVAVKKHKVWA